LTWLYNMKRLKKGTTGPKRNKLKSR